MRKIIIVMLATTIVVPNFVFAAWWNPFSWFDFFHNKFASPMLMAPVSSDIAKTSVAKSEVVGPIGIVSQKNESGTIASHQKLQNKTSNVYKESNPSTLRTIQSQAQAPTAQQTFTTPNGAVVDSNGIVIHSAPTTNQSLTEQSQVTKSDDKVIGEDYFDAHQSCIGLYNNQYAYCLDHAYNISTNNSRPQQVIVPQDSPSVSQQQTPEVSPPTPTETILEGLNGKIAQLQGQSNNCISTMGSINGNPIEAQAQAQSCQTISSELSDFLQVKNFIQQGGYMTETCFDNISSLESKLALLRQNARGEEMGYSIMPAPIARDSAEAVAQAELQQEGPILQAIQLSLYHCQN